MVMVGLGGLLLVSVRIWCLGGACVCLRERLLEMVVDGIPGLACTISG